MCSIAKERSKISNFNYNLNRYVLYRHRVDRFYGSIITKNDHDTEKEGLYIEHFFPKQKKKKKRKNTNFVPSRMRSFSINFSYDPEDRFIRSRFFPIVGSTRVSTVTSRAWVWWDETSHSANRRDN